MSNPFSQFTKIKVEQGPVFRFILIVLFLIIASERGQGQEEKGYDEVSIMVTVPRIGNAEIPALVNNEEVYLGIKDLFDYLRIKNTNFPDLDSIKGYVINPSNSFVIDKIHNYIIFKDKRTELKPNELIRTETNLYLRSDYFGRIFGLVCGFNFRNLSITLTTTLELPAVLEMNQEIMRRNI
ncbi:MAG TPA: hypothetical protein VGO09_06630, partial [Flavisolibacter sp.]|nr:hypothetical protein [Flavisolibacter sp.]